MNIVIAIMVGAIIAGVAFTHAFVKFINDLVKEWKK